MSELAHGLASWLRCRLRAVAIAIALVLGIALVGETVRLLGGL